VYIITGIWLQEHAGVDIDFDRTGAIPVWRTAMCRHLFAGVVWNGTDGTFEGSMLYQVGTSELSDIRLSGKMLTFTKKYSHRDDFIEYLFAKQSDGTWSGGYSGEACGAGKARCIVTEVADEFFAISN